MSQFGNYHIGSGDTRRAHLAVVEGGASASTNATSSVARQGRQSAATAYAGTAVESPRSRHEAGVRAVARNFDNFHDALLPMVLASGVSGERAASVANAILANPALRAQAERAFQRARIDVV